jgi:hypothetical protein
MVTYKPITFADGTTVTPKSAAESVTLRKKLVAEQNAASGTISTAQKTAEAKKQGLSTVGGVYTESRGQEIAKDAGQTTAFADNPAQFSGYRDEQGLLDLPDAYSGLSDYTPPKASETASATENALAKAQYDLSYVKSALSASAAETASIRTSVGAEQERATVQAAQDENKQMNLFGVDKTTTTTENLVMNPEYAKLSTNEKILNQQRKEAGESFIPDKISAQSGRAPIKDKLSKEQKLSAQELSQTVSALGDKSLEVLSANFDLLSPAQKAAARDYMSTQAQSRALALVQETSQNVKEELSAQERLIRAQLNMSDTDVLTFTDDGQPLINKKTVSQDAIDRAKEDVQEAKTDWLDTNKENFDNQIARIKSANTVDGNITDKGLDELAEAERDYAKLKEDAFEEIDDNLQEYTNKQKANQAQIDLDQAQANSIQGTLQRQLAQDKAEGAFNIQVEQAKIGNEIGFSTAIKEYEKREAYGASEPKYADIAKSLDGKILTASFDKNLAFDTAVEAFGSDISSTEKYLKSRGFLEKDILAQKQAYQTTVLGYTPEEVIGEQKKERVEILFQKSLGGEELSLEELDQISLYEAEYPKEARRIELRETTDLTNAEIWLQTNAEFKAPTKTKTTTKAELSNAGKLFLEDNPDFGIDDITDDGKDYGILAKDKEILKGMIIKKRGEIEETTEETTEEPEEVYTPPVKREEEEGFFDRLKDFFSGDEEKTGISGTSTNSELAEKLRKAREEIQ